MTTLTPTKEILPPPTERSTVLGWMKKNLFGSIGDTILTLVAGAFLVWLIYTIVMWITTKAQWAAVTDNLQLFMKGQYPPAADWRLWLLLFLLALIVGLMWGIAIKRPTGAGWVLLIVPLLLAIWLFTLGRESWLMLLLLALFAVIGYSLGKLHPKSWMFLVLPIILAAWLFLRSEYSITIDGGLWLIFLVTAGLLWAATFKRPKGLIWTVLFGVVILVALGVMAWLFTQGQPSVWRMLLLIDFLAYIAYLLGKQNPKKLSRFVYFWALIYMPLVILIVRGFGEDGFLFYVPTNLWGGLLLSLLLAIFAIVFSFPIGVLLALGRQSKLPAVKALSVLYIELIRGVPLITLLFMGQLMLPLFLPPGITIDRVLRAIVAMIMFAAAYMAENVRGGLQSIPKGQYEAADALGLSGWQKMTFIILPQALRAVIPVLVGQFIGLFKDTSLVALLGLLDLLGIARGVLANPNYIGRQLEVFSFIAVIYWVFCYGMSYAARRLEIALGVGER